MEEDQTESELREEEEVSERAIFLRIHPYIDTDGYAPHPFLTIHALYVWRVLQGGEGACERISPLRYWLFTPELLSAIQG